MNVRALAWAIAAAELSCAAPNTGVTGPKSARASGSVEVIGVADGARVTDTRIALSAVEPPGAALAEVTFAVDDQPVATIRTPPWGWGPDGAPVRDAGEMSYGPHVIRVEARTKSGATLAREVHVTYVSPLPRVPSYAADVAPLVHAHCANCHDHGLARDLTTYERLRAMTPRLRASIREGRMPPDFAIDRDAKATFVAWCDGYTPP